MRFCRGKGQMGAPADIAVPDPSEQVSPFSAPLGLTYSPTETDSCATSSSLSFTDSSSSSFTQSSARDGDSTSTFSPKSPPEGLQKEEGRSHLHVLEERVRDGKQRNSAELKQIKKSACKEPLKESNRAMMGSHKRSTVRGFTRRTCCRCAGAFTADCAALCCCPCAIFSIGAFILVELPSAVACKVMTHLKRRLCITDMPTACSGRSGDSLFTPTQSRREPCEGMREKQPIRFDTQNLLKHFEAENVGFGCLSQKRE